MNLYRNAIIYDISNNITFEQVKIDNNKVICKNDDIRNDIKHKINGLNINICVFYVSLCDYDIIENTYYWNNVKKLDLYELPIYKKDNDFNEFISWYNLNFNNDKVDVYETTKFTKRKKYVFDDKDDCLKSVEWLQTNPKFKKFVQIFYHAGDFNDVERYGYIYIRSLFNTKLIDNIDRELENNVFNDNPIKIWNKFSVSFESIKNTMFYMMNKMKKGVLVCIKNNKLVVFLPFSKSNYTNDYYTELYFDDEDKKLLYKYYNLINNKNKNTNDIIKIKKQLEENTKHFFRKHGLSMKDVMFDRSKWVGNDCFFRYEDYEGDKSLALFQDLLVNLCENRVLPDSIFILNIRDHPVLHKELKDAYVNVVNRELDDKYKFNYYIPILSVGASEYTSDIPLITQDDWLRISKKYYPDDCANSYINIDHLNIDWKDKINKCVFRGSATGCFIDDTNVRIKATMLSKQHPDLLDAGIITFNRKPKKNIGKAITIIKPNFNKANFMTLEDKVKYKYILNLDGHVSAFRLGHELSLGSVVLIPKSHYYLWFSYLLKPYEHFVPVDNDLSNLISQINWCIDNDDKCKQIAINARNFYNKYLCEKGIYDYMQKILSQISFKSLNFKTYSMNIAIIIIYRNTSDNSRLVEKRKYLYWMNKILHNICDYDIVLVEQNYDDKFNIGKLKNIGYDYLTKTLNKQYDNFIFSDIDMIPDTNLLPYYFKTTDSINGIAYRGTRYEHMDTKNKTPFVGGVISCVGSVFEELNGYPNNFYGWEGEDVNLLLRMFDQDKPLYINKKGSVIDIEEDIEFKSKNVRDKVSELTKLNEREDYVYEKNIDYKNYHNNGLTTLFYDIIQVFEYEHNYHIIIDPLREKSIKEQPELYNFKPKQKDEYNIIKKNLRTIKQIYF